MVGVTDRDAREEHLDFETRLLLVESATDQLSEDFHELRDDLAESLDSVNEELERVNNILAELVEENEHLRDDLQEGRR